MSREIDQLLNDVCKRSLEHQFERLTGERIKVTDRILRDYCKASRDVEREQEILAAIDTLESAGYRVTKTRKP